jgi:hypothetical protein
VAKTADFGGHQCGPLMAISANFLVATDSVPKGCPLRRASLQLLHHGSIAQQIKDLNDNVNGQDGPSTRSRPLPLCPALTTDDFVIGQDGGLKGHPNAPDRTG